MKKLLIGILCLCLLAGCASQPALSQTEQAVASVTAAPTIVPATATPEPAATATPEPRPTQTYTGAYFQFDVPEDWQRQEYAEGVCFFPDPDDKDHTALLYQEMDNELKLTETSVDIALMLSPKKAITSIVEKALDSKGFTDFTLSPVDVSKTELNGATCYRGASDITMNGETYSCTGYAFLREEKIILLVWVGDETRYADGLDALYGSLKALN